MYLLPTGELVYFVAAVAVLYNVEEMTQRHYLGHTDDIKWSVAVLDAFHTFSRIRLIIIMSYTIQPISRFLSLFSMSLALNQQ